MINYDKVKIVLTGCDASSLPIYEELLHIFYFPFLNIFSFRNCPVRDGIWVEKCMQRECAVPLGTGYATDILSLTGQRFPVGDTFSTHIFSIAGKKEQKKIREHQRFPRFPRSKKTFESTSGGLKKSFSNFS